MKDARPCAVGHARSRAPRARCRSRPRPYRESRSRQRSPCPFGSRRGPRSTMPKASPSAPPASPSTVGGAIGAASGRSVSRERAGERDIVEVVTGRLRQRAILPPAGHPAIDELRIALGAIGRAEAEPFHHAGPVALDQRVGRLDQRQRRLDPLRALEIERHDSLAAPKRIVLLFAGRDCRASPCWA